MGNGYRRCGPHGAIGYKEYGVQGYRVQDIWATWAMGTGVWGILSHMYPLTPP